MIDAPHGSPGLVIWISGVSGAGKTTLGRALATRIEREQRQLPVFLDGDALRAAIHPDGGYTPGERNLIARRNARLCALISAQRHTVVCCSVSLRGAIYAYNRRLIGNYLDILIEGDLTAIERLDSKGLYAAARRGDATNVVGIDIPIEPPPSPFLKVLNDFQTPIEAHLDRIWPQIEARLRTVEAAG